MTYLGPLPRISPGCKVSAGAAVSSEASSPLRAPAVGGIHFFTVVDLMEACFLVTSRRENL